MRWKTASLHAETTLIFAALNDASVSTHSRPVSPAWQPSLDSYRLAQPVVVRSVLPVAASASRIQVLLQVAVAADSCTPLVPVSRRRDEDLLTGHLYCQLLPRHLTEP